MTVDAAPTAARTNSRQKRLEARAGYVLAFPAFLLMVTIFVVPTAVVIWLSATDYQLGAVSLGAVGLGNYVEILNDSVFWRSIRNTFLYVAIVVPGAVGLGLVVAILVHNRHRTKSFYQIVYFLPVTSTLIAMATVWQFVLNGRIGPVNQLLSAVGLPQINFFAEPGTVLLALAIIGIWQLVGFNMILFLAGLTAIPKDLYEAADVDGADHPWDRFVRVTWPLLGPTTMFVIVTTSITAFKVFDTVAVLTQGGPMGASEVILYAMYLEGFQYFRIGYASAMTAIFLTFIVMFAILQTIILDRKVHYS